MQRLFILFTLTLLVAAGAAFAQDATPTPTPTPAQAAANDAQPVAPENIKGVPAIAPGFRSDDRELPGLGRVGVDMTRQHTLTLQEALEAALNNNLDVEVIRKTSRMAEFDLKAARGFYEPRLTGQAAYERATIPNISFFTPTITSVTTNNLIGNAALQYQAPAFGTQFNARFNNTRAATDNPISIISPQYNSSFTFEMIQPLFRGRKFDQARRAIEIAKRNLTLTDTQFRQRSMDVVQQVEKAYWDLTYALRNLQVQKDAVKDAKDQLDHNRRLVNEGQLAPIDIVAAETQVANYEQAVYDALNTVNASENVLKTLISPNKNDAIWAEALTPVDSVVVKTPDTTLVEALDAAEKNRPELEVNQAQKDVNAIDQRYYREMKKPQIDLTASYTSAGVGGSLNPGFSNPLLRNCLADPTTADCVAAQQAQQSLLRSVGGSGTALSDIFVNKYPTYRVGVQFNLPLFGDRTNKANLGRSIVEGERIDVQRQQIEQNIQVEVRNALQAIRTAEARLRAASVARENSEKQYESEQRKLDAGQSDTYKVLERQTALTVARSNELRFRIELNKSIADLKRATGHSLIDNNITPSIK